MGLNAYEARSYLVLVGHPRFKALELAARAHVPRQKIYEVLDSLVEKGFAQVIQEKTKLFRRFRRIRPSPATSRGGRRRSKQQLAEQSRGRQGDGRRSDGRLRGRAGRRGTLDYLRIVSDPGQIAAQFRRMLAEARDRVSGIFAAALRGGSRWMPSW